MPSRQKCLFIPGCVGCHYLFSLCMCNIRGFYQLRELYEDNFHKHATYGSGRAWANTWEVFRHTRCRGGRGRRAAVDFVVCFGCGGISCFLGIYIFKFVHVCTTAGCERLRAVDVDSVKGLRPPANLPTENSTPRSPPGVPFIVLPPENHGVS